MRYYERFMVVQNLEVFEVYEGLGQVRVNVERVWSFKQHETYELAIKELESIPAQPILLSSFSIKKTLNQLPEKK